MPIAEIDTRCLSIIAERAPGRTRELPPASRARFLAAGALLLGVLYAPPVAAQLNQPAGEGLSTGPFVLYPSLSMEFIRDNNVLYTNDAAGPDDIVDSYVQVIKPGILVDFPFGANKIRWSYSPSYRNYSTAEVSQSEHVSHFFDLEANLKFGTGVSIIVRDHLVHGTTEIREIDPGGETTFGLVPFVLHQPEMTIDLALGPRQSVSTIPRYSKTRFDELTAASFFDFRRRGLEERYNFKITPLDTVYGYLSVDEMDQERPGTPPEDVKQDSRSVGVGFRRVINDAVTSSFSAGYQSLTFEGGADQEFSGAVMDAGASWRPGDTMRIDFSARRSAYPSFFENNNFYLNNELGIRIADQIGLRFFWLLSGTFQINRYPLVSPTYGVRRRDNALRLEAGVGRQFLRTLRGFVGYNYDRRDSNVDAATYGVERFVFRIEMGWL